MSIEEFENLHPRATTGKFADKVQSSPEISIELNPARIPNYDRVEDVDGARVYTRNGLLHRTDGYAIEDVNGGFYYLNGEPAAHPDGDEEFFLNAAFADGSQEWRTAGGEHYAWVHADDSVAFFLDGDLHRKGRPAIAFPDGTGIWLSRGTILDDPRPAAPTVTRDEAADTVTTTGSRYEEGVNVNDLRAKLRKDIALAVRAGTLDDLGVTYTVNVLKSRGQDRPELRVTVTGLNRHSVIRTASVVDEDTSQPFYTDDALSLIHTLEDLGQAYNQTTVHNGTDSIKSPFYLNVVIPTTAPTTF